MAVGRQQSHLQAAFPERCESQAKAFRHFVKGIDVGKAQRAKRESAQKHGERNPCVFPAFKNAAFAVNDRPGYQKQSDRPGHDKEI